MVERKLRVDVDTERRTDLDTTQSDEGKFQVLIHNDDVTPYDFVIQVLRHIFHLSGELAEHITWEAHTKGVAPVVTRARSEAERLVNKAHGVARASGYPLTFTIEPKS